MSNDDIQVEMGRRVLDYCTAPLLALLDKTVTADGDSAGDQVFAKVKRLFWLHSVGVVVFEQGCFDFPLPDIDLPQRSEIN